MMKRVAIVIQMLFLAGMALGAEWLHSLPEAQRQAEAGQKLVLVDFTGSDWCAPCIQLRRRVLDAPAFEQYAADKFVLLEVDLPMRKDFDAALRAENEALCKRYGVKGFPTVLVLTADGRSVGGFPPVVKDVKTAIRALEQARESVSLLEQASACQGAERAELLGRVYWNLPEGKPFAALREQLSRDIAEACPQDVTGALADAAVRVQAADFARQRDAMPLNDPRLPALLDRQMAEALPANRPEILRTRVQYGMATAESVEELEVVRRQLEELIPQLPPEEAQVEQNLLDKFFHDLPALLETLRRNR